MLEISVLQVVTDDLTINNIQFAERSIRYQAALYSFKCKFVDIYMTYLSEIILK